MAATPLHDGLTNGCSTIGISKTAPVEVMEQYYPGPLPPLRAARGLRRGGRASRRLRRALRGGAAARRGARILRHGPRPLRAAGRAGRHGRCAERRAHPSRRRGDRSPSISPRTRTSAMQAGDRVEVMTPGGGGYGDPFARDAGAGRARRAPGLLHAARRRASCSAWSCERCRRDRHGGDASACAPASSG